MHATPAPARPGDVYFFGTCLLDLFLPEAGLAAGEGGLATAALRLRKMHAHAFTSGQPGEAREVARSQLGLFDQPWPIVVPSGSCGGMIKHHWPTLFAGDADEARACAVAGRVVEFADFLLNVLRIELRDQGKPTKVAVHTSCSARREMNTHVHGWALVDQLAQVERVVHDHESECCGFGGVFSLRHPDISGAMVSDKSAALQDSGAVEFVTADGGCLLNINGKLAHDGKAFRGKHLASFLLERTGGKA